MNSEKETTVELMTLVQSSGLETKKQNQIAETLGVFFNKAAEWDKTITSIVITSPEEVGKMKMAKEGRITLKNMRLDADKIVKAKRDEVKNAMSNYVLEDKLWLKAWQMMEATYKNLESKLEEKEKFAERWEAEEKEKLKQQRLSELEPLGFVYSPGFNLESMDEQMFQSLKSGLISAKKEREEAAAKAEEERIAKEKAVQLSFERDRELRKYEDFSANIIDLNNFELGTLSTEEFEEIKNKLVDAKKVFDEAQEAQRLENEKLKAEAEKRESELAAEKAKAEKERIKQQEAAAKAKAEADAKLKAEQDAKAKLEAEIKAKADAEAKAAKEAEEKKQADEKAKIAAEKKAKAAPDKEKLIKFADQLDAIELPEITNEEALKVIEDTKTLIAKTTTYIRNKANSI